MNSDLDQSLGRVQPPDDDARTQRSDRIGRDRYSVCSLEPLSQVVNSMMPWR